MTIQLVEKRLSPELMLQELDAFVTKIEALVSMLRLDLSLAQADHIALRINDIEIAKQAHQAWSQYGKVISQAQINGRPIIVFEFGKVLESRGWKIECLELPYPAEGKIYPTEGWEHVEFVIPSHAETADEFLADIKHRYPEFGAHFKKVEEMGVKIKLSSPKGEGERLNNPTVAFKYQGVCIKLHPHSLKAIIESEG
nr:VOC family protein [uncultured Vibrio sp.]